MKGNKNIFWATVICWLSLAFSACETDNKKSEPATLKFNMSTSEGSLSSPTNNVLQELVYTILIFQSAGTHSAESDGSDFKFWKKAENGAGSDILTLEEVRKYSLSIPVEESDRSYLLLIHATPKIMETTLSNYEGNTFRDTKISMIKISGAYIPLSKDNYYAIRKLTSIDIANGETSMEFLLKRAVGQVVFDVVKCKPSLNGTPPIPVDIDPAYSSTLDRVYRIKTKISGALSSVCLINETTNSDRIELTIDNSIKLNEKYFPIFEENEKVIEPLTENNLPTGSNKNVKGGTRICGPYLLAALTPDDIQSTAEGDIGIVLYFSYHDTTELSGGGYNPKELTLDLSRKKQQVAKDCYTITNIRIVNDRIIDIDVSGDINLDYTWD